MNLSAPPRLSPVSLLLIGAALLAFHPAQWLVQTWTDASYDSYGMWVFGCVVGLLLWSVTSPLDGVPQARDQAIWMVTGAALVRLLGQVLAIRTLSALTLVVDVYALGRYLGLEQRRRALSPGWLAVLFALSLPVERMIQRLGGFALQQLSAAGACGVLKLGLNDTVQCEGVRLVVAGKDVLVDLPCSGARAMFILLLAFVVLSALVRPSPLRALEGVAVTLTAAVLSNVVRITALALGLAYPTRIGGIDVMAQPWHDLVGLTTLAVALAAVVRWSDRQRLANTASDRCTPALQTSDPGALPVPTPNEAAQEPGEPGCDMLPVSSPQPSSGLNSAGAKTERTVTTNGLRSRVVLAIVPLALVILLAPEHPVDIASHVEPVRLPAWLEGHHAEQLPLNGLEQTYFVRYGGSAARARYGDEVLMMVRTSAPLRHLHAPDECLTGAGHKVQHLGLSYTSMPSAVYRSIAPDGKIYRVEVSFVSSDGSFATSVSEVTWSWMQRQGEVWTELQRITPWNLPPERRLHFDQALVRALDLRTGSSRPPQDRGLEQVPDGPPSPMLRRSSESSAEPGSSDEALTM